jgi:hypothetical protein
MRRRAAALQKSVQPRGRVEAGRISLAAELPAALVVLRNLG